jgi:hypothetical protein
MNRLVLIWGVIALVIVALFVALLAPPRQNPPETT